MLRKQRELKGFSQEYVAGLVGISASVISKIETGKTKARFDVIVSVSAMQPFFNHYACYLCCNIIKPSKIC